MNGSRLTKCMFCRLLHAASLNNKLQCIQRTRFVRASLYGNSRVSFATYQRLLKENDGNGTSSSSSSDSSDSDSDREQVKGRKELTSNRVDPGDILRILTKGGHKGTDNKVSNGSEQSAPDSKKLLNILKKSGEKMPPVKQADISDSVNKELVQEAEKLSKVLPGNPQETESKLLGQLLSQFETTARQKSGADPKPAPRKSTKSLSEVMEGITVKKASTKDQRKDFDIYQEDVIEKSQIFRTRGTGLLAGKPIGIFTKEYMKTAKKDKEGLFEKVAEERKCLSRFYPPENAFEEHIQWTREGKLWTFPIDNEAGWESEKNTGFEEHVFLETELVGFPRKGPIRHFMELVTVSLSKNPYLTVEQKRENIEWYRAYFMEKGEMLEQQLGVDGVVQPKESLTK